MHFNGTNFPRGGNIFRYQVEVKTVEEHRIKNLGALISTTKTGGALHFAFVSFSCIDVETRQRISSVIRSELKLDGITSHSNVNFVKISSKSQEA